MTQNRRPQDGFTLIELIVSVVILTMITAGITSAFLTSLKSTGSTSARVHASDDAQVIAAFLVRDAQAAGSVDPTNPTPQGDPTLGVTLGNPAGGATFTDPSGCSSGVLVFRFAWLDWATPTVSHRHVANYFYAAATRQLVRTTCTDGGAAKTSTIGNDITAVSPSCNPVACPPIPESVALGITATTTSSSYPAPPYSYTLRATVRPQGQASPSGGTTVGLPTLLALGGSCPSTPGITEGGSNTTVTVNGATVVNGQTSPTDPACQLISTGPATFTATPAPVYPPNGVPDPYLTLPPPNDPTGQPFSESADCLGGANPATTTVGGVVHYHPGVYQLSLSVTQDRTFDPGVYFFCNGFSISGTAHVTATGVLFYVAQGAFSVAAANTQMTLSGLTSGPDAGFAVWMPRTNTTTSLSLAGNTNVNQYNGLIYVPNVDVTISGSSGVQIGSIIAHRISFSGNGNTHIGPYTPTVGAPNPTSGLVGTSVSITGSGFIASSPLTIQVGGTNAIITGGATSNTNGNVTATFTVPNLAPGNYAVSVTDSGPNTATSGTQFTVVPPFGAPTKLVFTRQPSNASPNAAFPTQPQVTVEDAAGNTVTNDTSTVTLALTAGTPTAGGPGTLTGCTQTEALGVITFSGCQLNTAGTGYKLHATDGALTAADSNGFNVAGPAVKLVLAAATTTPSAGAADNLTITAQDSAGNTATSYNGNKTLTFSGATTIGAFHPTVTNSTGTATNFGTGETINFVNGVAQVSVNNNGQMVLYKAETASIVVSDGSINNGSGLSVTVSAASVMTLTNCVVQGNAQPCNGTYQLGNGGSMTAKVTLTDPYGNVPPNTTMSMTVTSGDVTKYTVSGSPITITNGTVSTTLTVNKLGNGSNTTTITVHATSGSYADLVFNPVK